MSRKSTREKRPTEKAAASHSHKSKKGVARSRESKIRGAKATTAQSTHKGKKRKLSTSGEDSDESRRGSEENLTSKKSKKRSRVYDAGSGDEAIVEDDEAIPEEADDEVEVLSQPSGSENDGETRSDDDENASEHGAGVCVAVNEILSIS